MYVLIPVYRQLYHRHRGSCYCICFNVVKVMRLAWLPDAIGFSASKTSGVYLKSGITPDKRDSTLLSIRMLCNPARPIQANNMFNNPSSYTISREH